MRILCFLITASIVFLFQGCEEKKQPVVKEKRKYAGSLEVLNSCGEVGSAAKMTSFLRKNGFDVVSYRNDRLQNYDETILVLRNPEWEGAQALAQTLNTRNILTVASKRANDIDAVVYIGKDFHQIIDPDQGEQNDN